VTLFDDGKVIIEVGLNERTSKDDNSNVPYGVDEVVADGIACAGAGAAVLHFHARDQSGAQVWDGTDIYRREMAGIRQHSAVLMYPSYNASFGPIVELLESPPAGAPLDMVPFDVFQSVGLVNWDQATRSFREIQIEWMPSVSKGDRPAILDDVYERGHVPTVCVQELGDLRWTRLALEAGILRPPVALKIFVMGKYVRGPEPSPAGLDAMLSHVTPEMEATVVPSRMTSPQVTEDLLRHALDRGVHVRVGIGDNPQAFPTQTNAELVEWAVELVHQAGLQPATPDEVRSFFHTGAAPVIGGHR
jgi:3-keto-5-aminohexanoate cleavage enzyme